MLPSGLFRIASLFSAILLATPIGSAQWGSGPTVYDRGDFLEHYYSENVDATIKAHSDDLLGDHIDIDTGRLTFRHTDINIPGNFDIPVRLGRRAETPYYDVTKQNGFSDWMVDIPFIRVRLLAGSTWPATRCSDKPHNFPQYPYQPVAYKPYWDGLKLYTPGDGERLIYNPNRSYQIFPNASTQQFLPNTPTKVSMDNWLVDCISSIPAGGEGFLVTAPNGDKYHFDTFRKFTGHTYHSGPYSTITGPYPTENNVLFPSKIEDVNGNWVQFQYNNYGPTRIWASDGREINITYSGTRISSATAHGRTWTYSYHSGNSALKTVTLPDGRTWEFSTDIGELNKVGEDACLNDVTFVSVKHPDGVVGEFRLRQIQNGQTGAAVTDSRYNTSTYESYRYYFGSCRYSSGVWAQQPLFFSNAVTERKMIVPQGGTRVWTYTYEEDTGSLDIGASFPSEKKRTIIDPSGAKTVVEVHRGVGRLNGKIFRRHRYASASSTTPLESVETSYMSNYSQFDWLSIEDTYLGPTEDVNKALTLYKSRDVITRGSDTYTTDYTYNTDKSSALYSFGTPVSYTLSSSLTPETRVADVTYRYDKGDWILLQPDTLTRNGKIFDEYTYDSLGRVTAIDQFGTRVATFTHNSDGTIATVKDALNRTYTLGTYKRGRAQSVTRPDGLSESRTIDDLGQITSATNARGHTTNYQYNNAGWLTQIDRPGSWADTTLTYASLGSGLQQVATRGDYKTKTTLDGMFRPILDERRSLSTSESIFINRSYDPLGRVSFESWPSFSSTATAGMSYTYDALGRVLTESETVAPNATVSYAYLSNNRTQMTDAAGAPTTTTYRAFGSPATDEAMQVVDATGTTTNFTRDIYGNVLTLNQSSGLNGYSVNVTRQFWYDTRLRLCRHRAPEFGDELFVHNNANELVSASRGEAAGSGCGTPTPALAIDYTYDALGRQTGVDFPDVSPDITKYYDGNSNLTSVVRGSTQWSYAYNELDLIDTEMLTIGSKAYSIFHNYNTTGNIFSRIVPGGAEFKFNPDGFGRPTRIKQTGTSSDFISNITYHPNDVAASADYQNGLDFTQTLTPRQLVANLQVMDGSSAVVDLRHTYDVRRKITDIDDFALSGHDRTFGYDLRGRLDTASGVWGVASFDYDGLDNIRGKTLGARTVSVSYDAATNLVDQVVDSASGTRAFSYDGRGNVTDNGPVTLTYDFSNQPTGMSGAGFSAAYTYDGNLKRVKSVEGGETHYWVYSALTGTPLYKENATTSEVTHYVSAGGAALRLVNGTAEFTHLDTQGSPVAATNGAGSVLWREHYTPFGEKTVDPADNRDDVGYTGHVQDDASGLTYMQARYYDPVVGRFLSTDPIGYQDQLNLYAYVANDPVNAIDPSGMNQVRRDSQSPCHNDPESCSGGGATLAVGGEVEAIIGEGNGGSAGVFVNVSGEGGGLTIGTFAATKDGVGADVEASVAVSVTGGEVSDFGGESTSVEFDARASLAGGPSVTGEVGATESGQPIVAVEIGVGGGPSGAGIYSKQTTVTSSITIGGGGSRPGAKIRRENRLVRPTS